MLSRFCILSFLFVTAAAHAAELKLAPLFRDGAVLQRDHPNPVWGWSEPNEIVDLVFGDQKHSTKSDQNGKWIVTLDPLPTNPEPQVLTVESGEHRLQITDILVGEVWLCSGQSNMAMRVDLAKDPEKEKAAADLPKLRVFPVGRKASSSPLVDCEGEWIVSTPQTAGRFSATAFFFGREIHQELDIPVGLIVSAWSGSAIEAWTSGEAQQKEPALTVLRKSWSEKDAAYTTEIEAAEKAKYDSDITKWKAVSKNERGKAPRRPINPRFHHHHPDVLFNGMIAPLIPYGIRGAIWYQGETNALTEESSALYETQLPLLVNDWRARWHQGDFPMAWVQLPFTSANKVAWPRIRESMRRASDKLPNTGMAITIDLGEERSLHPKNKQAFAHRLALWARSEVYGEKIPWSGPLPTGVNNGDGIFQIEFRHCDGGLTTRGDKLMGFEVLDQNDEWKPVTAVIEGRSIVTFHFTSPKAVRYGWANHPDGNLFNQVGLPASPFELTILGSKASLKK